MKITAELRCWTVFKVAKHYYLIGEVYGDTSYRFEDGRFIQTSAIKSLTKYQKNREIYCIVETQNSFYKIDERYSLSNMLQELLANDNE
jgi:hypothetical protein